MLILFIHCCCARDSDLIQGVDDHLESLQSLWVTEMVATMDSLRFFQTRHRLQPDRSLALVVVTGPRVGLMQWVLEGKTGRIAEIDEEFRVKAIVPVGGKKSPIKPESIIIANTGVFMEKVRKKERPYVPPEVQRLMRIWEHGMMNHQDQEEALQEQEEGFFEMCAYCKSPRDPDGSSSRAQPCSFCMLDAHDSCVKKYVLNTVLDPLHVGIGAGPSQASSDSRTTATATPFIRLHQSQCADGPLPLDFRQLRPGELGHYLKSYPPSVVFARRCCACHSYLQAAGFAKDQPGLHVFGWSQIVFSF